MIPVRSLRRIVLAAFVLLAAVSSLAETNGAVDVDVIIEFAELPRPHRFRDDLGRVARTAAIRREFRQAFSGVSARVPRSALPAIAALPYVKAIHKDGVVRALVTRSVPRVRAPEVWTRFGARGKGITVAVIDSGIDYKHHSLGGGFGPGRKVAAGYDFADEDSDPMDQFGHGTAIAGIIAGDEAPVIGVAPEATLIAYKVLGRDGTGRDSAILAAIERSIDPNGDGDLSDRVDVVNLSLGRPTWGGDDPLVRAVERVVAAGVVVVVAAGNTGEALQIHTPAIAPSVITVGSTDIDNDGVSDFSSRGPVPGTWSLKPDVAAPGAGIISARVNGEATQMSGTSMSAPHVAGIAALIREVHPDWTPEEVKGAIVSTAKPLRTAGQLRALAAGGGLLDAVAAVEATVLPSPAVVAFGVVTSSATRTLRLTNRATDARTLTIAMPDTPVGATLTATPSTVAIPRDGSVDVTLTLTITGPLAASDENVGASGSVEITGGTTSLHVPWVVMAGNQIAVAYRGREPHELHVVTPARDALAFIEDPQTMATIVEPGAAADIVVLTFPEQGQPKMIVRERQPVSGFTYLTIDPEEATLQLDVAGVDSGGALLSARAGRQVAQELVLPSGRTIEWRPLSTPIAASPMQSTKLRTYEVAENHFGMHRVLSGLTRNESLTFPSSDWIPQPIELRCAVLCDFAGAIGFGHRIGYRVLAGTGTAFDGTFHVTPSREEGFSFRAYAMTRRPGQGDSVQRKSWTMLSPALQTDGGRVTLRASDGSWPVDYTPPRAASPVRFGEGPGLIRTEMGPRSANEWSVNAVPIGPLGEDLAESQQRLSFSMVDSQEKAVKFQLVFVAGVFVTTSALPPDTYRLRVVNDTHRVNGEKARGTLTSHFDSRIHPAAPTLTSLRIEDGSGSAVSVVQSGDRARLLFSARHSTTSFGTVTHRPVVDSATKAWWRATGTTEWQALPIAIVASDYEGSSPAGTVFSADLQSMSRMANGPVDLKIEISDSFGGRSEWLLEPALAVVKTVTPAKRRSVR